MLDVTNDVVVRFPGGAERSDTDLAIEAALERRAEREAQQLSLRVDQGVVTVSGIVRTRAERLPCSAPFGEPPGCPGLTNDLRIQSDAR